MSTRVIVLTFYVLSNGLSVDHLNYEFNTNNFMFLPLPDSNFSPCKETIRILRCVTRINSLCCVDTETAVWRLKSMLTITRGNAGAFVDTDIYDFQRFWRRRLTVHGSNVRCTPKKNRNETKWCPIATRRWRTHEITPVAVQHVIRSF
jgi:hypothetical protein